jgi:Tfp pilus assembly protein PilV
MLVKLNQASVVLQDGFSDSEPLGTSLSRGEMLLTSGTNLIIRTRPEPFEPPDIQADCFVTMIFARPAHFRFRARSAHTLIETLVAAAFLGISVISLYAGFFSGFQVTHLSRENVRATQIMLKKIEAIRLCSWDQLSNFPTFFQETFDAQPVSNGLADLVYYGSVNFAPADAVGDAAYKNDMLLVTVSLAWTNSNGRTPIVHQQQMQTHVARYGSQNYAWGVQ